MSSAAARSSTMATQLMGTHDSEAWGPMQSLGLTLMVERFQRLEVSINGWSYTDGVSATSGLSNSQKVGSKPLMETPKKKMCVLHTRTEPGLPNVEMKEEIVLRKWCRHMNHRSPSTVPLALDLVEKGLRKLGSLSRQKIRICLAASLWLATTLCEKQAYVLIRTLGF